MRIFKTVVCALLALVIFAGVFGGTVMLAARGVISDSEKLADRIGDDEYYSVVCAAVREDVYKAQLLLSIGDGVFDNAVSDGDITNAAKDELKALMIYILRDRSQEGRRFESEKLLSAIRADIEAYAEEHELIAEEGAAEEVYDYLCRRVTAQIRVISETYLKKIPELSPLNKLLSLWYVPFCAAVLCAAAIALIRRRELTRALNTVVVPVYSAAFFGLVLSRILSIKDYISKVSLEQSALRTLLIRFYRVTVGSVEKCFGVALTAALVLLVCDIVLVARFGYGKRPDKPADAPEEKPGEAPAPSDAE